MTTEMKSSLIALSVFLAAGFFWYLSKWQHDKKQDLKSYPTKFAYHIRNDSSVLQALGSESRDCSIHIKAYTETLDKGMTAYLPTCVDFMVTLGATVHILSEEDSLSMKVAYFYISSNRKERHN